MTQPAHIVREPIPGSEYTSRDRCLHCSTIVRYGLPCGVEGWRFASPDFIAAHADCKPARVATTLTAPQLALLRKITLLGPVPLDELSGADKCRAWALFRRGLIAQACERTAWGGTVMGEKAVAEAAGVTKP